MSPKPLKYLIVHCSATYDKQEISANQIERWHKGANDQDDGSVIFNKKRYASREDLPVGMIGGVEIKKSRGRGWSRVGYSDLILLDGSRHKYVDHNNDDLVDYNEITFGAKGVNAESRHVCYVGGLDTKENGGKPKKTINSAQTETLCQIMDEVLSYKPDILIAGHNQFANKACPSFWVPDFIKNEFFDYKFKSVIFDKDPFGYGK